MSCPFAVRLASHHLPSACSLTRPHCNARAVSLSPCTVSQAVEQLKEQRGNLSLRRTVSVDNVVTATSGYAVSTPCVTKRRGVRNHVKCAGHSFVVSVYFCTTPRW